MNVQQHVGGSVCDGHLLLLYFCHLHACVHVYVCVYSGKKLIPGLKEDHCLVRWETKEKKRARKREQARASLSAPVKHAREGFKSSSSSIRCHTWTHTCAHRKDTSRAWRKCRGQEVVSRMYPLPSPEHESISGLMLLPLMDLLCVSPSPCNCFAPWEDNT